MALITATEARSLLPGITGTGEDVALAVVVAQVDAALAQFCGFPVPAAGHPKTLESTTYNLYVEGSGGRFLWLPLRPVSAVASIYDDTGLSYGADRLVAATDYTVYPDDGLVLLNETAAHGSWSAGYPRAIKATVTAGFTTTPGPLKRAAERLVQHWWTARYSGTHESVSRGGATVRPSAEDMPADVRALLAPYICADSGGVS